MALRRSPNFQLLLTLSSPVWTNFKNIKKTSHLSRTLTAILCSRYSTSPNSHILSQNDIHNYSHSENPVPLTSSDPDSSHLQVHSPPNSKLLKVSIIGVPNAGKSTLINQIMSLDVCPTSKRVHTTRKNQCSVYLDNNTQVVFVDTPGLVNSKEAKKFEFSKDFVQGPKYAIANSDVVAVIHDVSNSYYRQKLDRRLLDTLNEFPDKLSVLVLNKVDAIKSKRKLLETVRILTNSTVGGVPIKTVEKAQRKRKVRQSVDELLNEISNKNERVDPVKDESQHQIDKADEPVGWSGFKDVFMISALTGDGVDRLKEYFVENATNSTWMYSEDMLTDCPPIELAMRVLQAKLLENLPDEVPYKVKPVLDFWDTNESGTPKLMYTIDCPNERLVKMIIGQGGNMINTITMQIEKALTNVLQQNSDIFIKVICSKTDVDKKN